MDEISRSEKGVDGEQVYPSDVSTNQVLSIDPERERKLVRKLDIWIAPIMTIIFLTAYLDRANIGNAASAGMSEDIGMSSGQLGSKSFRLEGQSRTCED